MAERIRVGDRLPFFLYDTPYSAGNRFRDLLDAQAPLVLVFMANFGHPITPPHLRPAVRPTRAVRPPHRPTPALPKGWTRPRRSPPTAATPRT